MENNEKDWKVIRERYTTRYAEFGYSEKAVGWGAKGRQKLRYDILLGYWGAFDGLSLVDLGAGFGDGCKPFFDGGGKNYIGLEFLSEFVAIGNHQFSDYGDRFKLQQSNIAEQKTLPSADLIIGSGLFNSRFSYLDNNEFIASTLSKAFSVCKKGIAFNFLSDDTDFKEDYIFYTTPSKIVSLIEQFSRNYCLKKDYFPFEFSVYVSKDDSFNMSTSIFSNPKYL